jgi:hypothetical protein
MIIYIFENVTYREINMEFYKSSYKKLYIFFQDANHKKIGVYGIPNPKYIPKFGQNAPGTPKYVRLSSRT